MAKGLPDDMGREYARCINAVIANLDYCRQEPVEAELAGSIFVKGEIPRAIKKIRQDVSLKNEDKEKVLKAFVQ